MWAGVGSEEEDREKEDTEAMGRERQGAGDLEAPQAVCPVLCSADNQASTLDQQPSHGHTHHPTNEETEARK